MLASPFLFGAMKSDSRRRWVYYRWKGRLKEGASERVSECLTGVEAFVCVLCRCGEANINLAFLFNDEGGYMFLKMYVFAQFRGIVFGEPENGAKIIAGK